MPGYLFIPEDRRPCFACLTRIFGNHRNDEREIPIQIKALTAYLDEYLPPHLIEEVRGQIFDIISNPQ